MLSLEIVKAATITVGSSSRVKQCVFPISWDEKSMTSSLKKGSKSLCPQVNSLQVFRISSSYNLKEHLVSKKFSGSGNLLYLLAFFKICWAIDTCSEKFTVPFLFSLLAALTTKSLATLSLRTGVDLIAIAIFILQSLYTCSGVFLRLQPGNVAYNRLAYQIFDYRYTQKFIQKFVILRLTIASRGRTVESVTRAVLIN